VQRQIAKERKSQRRLGRKLGTAAIKFGPKPLKRLAKRIMPSRALKFTGWQGDRLPNLKQRLVERGFAFSDADLDRVAELSLRYQSPVRV
jgi:hypothetical protein